MIVHKNRFLIIWILALVGSIALITFKMYEYLIFTGIAFVFAFIFWLIALNDSKDENKVYHSFLNEILKTFDSVLIKVNEIPDLANRNIIKVNSIEDLIDAQVEIRKPIYYFLDVSSCTFILLDDKELCLFVLRKNNDVVAAIDGILEEEENKKRIKTERDKKHQEDSNLLDDIENTTIIKFNNRSFRVSPIRDKEKIEEVKEEPKLEEVPEVKEEIKEKPKKKGFELPKLKDERK